MDMDVGTLPAVDPLTQWLSDFSSLKGFSSQLWACCVTYIESHTLPPVVLGNKTLYEMNACVCSCVLAQKAWPWANKILSSNFTFKNHQFFLVFYLFVFLCKLEHQNQPSYREWHLIMQNLVYLMMKIIQNAFSKTLAIVFGCVARERKLQLSRCVRFLGCFSAWIISVITCLLCHCHNHRFLKIGLWGLLTAVVWTCLFERKSACHGQLLFLSASSSEDLKRH